MKVINLELNVINNNGEVMLTIYTIKNGKPFTIRLYNDEAIRVFTNVKDLIEIMTNDIKREVKDNDRHNRTRSR